MLLMHQIAVQYGVAPSAQIGEPPHSWAGFLVNVAAERVGDRHKAAMMRRAGMVFPAVVIQ